MATKIHCTFSNLFSYSQGKPTLRYPELERLILSQTKPISVQNVRDAVLQLRGQKSMLLDSEDENHRSVGSFFLNPVLPKEKISNIVEHALHGGLIQQEQELPKYEMGSSYVKLSAAWLIEKSGVQKGQSFGRIGISSKHTLCLVHHGGGTSRELLRVATWIQQRVMDHFGVWLKPEPNFIGFADSDLQELFQEKSYFV